jgi:hypothetical protein
MTAPFASPCKYAANTPSCLESNIRHLMATTGQFRLEVSFGEASFAAEGAPKQVMDAYAEFRQDALGESGKAEEAGTTTKHETSKRNDTGSTWKASDARVPLPVFLKTHPPKTNDQTVAVLATWAAEHEGVTEITNKKIEELWGKTGRRKPKNLPRDIGKAVTNGWLDSSGRGKYSVPVYGTNYVRGLKPAPDTK